MCQPLSGCQMTAPDVVGSFIGPQAGRLTVLELDSDLGRFEPAPAGTARRARGTQESGTVNLTARVSSRASGASHAASIVRSVRIATLGLISVALAGLLVVPTSLPAAADPPVTVAEAKAAIEQLQTDAAAIDQQYAGVKEQIKEGRDQLKLKQADVKAQTDKVERMRLQVGQVALAQFQNRNLDTAAQLIVTQDTEGFLSQISTVQKVSE